MPDNDEVRSLLATQMEELRHRLRNHLQNMISLISMQIRRAQNEETIAALEDLRARFASITSIYIDLDNSVITRSRSRRSCPTWCAASEIFTIRAARTRPNSTWRRSRCRASAAQSSARSWSNW